MCEAALHNLIRNCNSFVMDALPDNINKVLDLEDIEVSRESFVDRNLASQQSDILIRARLRKSPVLIYILVEHKSHPYRWTVFQLRPVMFNLQQLDDKEIRGGIFYQAALKAFKYGAGNLSPHLVEMLHEERKAFISVLCGYIISVGSDTTDEYIGKGTSGYRFRGVVGGIHDITEEIIEKGKIEGKIKAKQYILPRLLDKKFDSVDEVEKEKIISVRDRDKLGRAIDRIG